MPLGNATVQSHFSFRNLNMSNLQDKEILNHIFNPLLPNGGELVVEEDIPEDLKDESEDLLISPEITAKAKALEIQGVEAVEKGNYEAGLQFLNQAISLCPFRASGYNNRAQTFRLIGKIDEAKQDLNNAINLSHGKGKAGCQAYCQRGLIYLKENQTENAKHDFEAAAKLGSQFAKAQLVQLNPYAALCNKMLRDVMGKLQRGESEEYGSKDCNMQKC